MGCRSRETLQNLCDQIPGDALLYSMFKVDAEPIKCPIRGELNILRLGEISLTTFRSAGPFTFTYNRGHGECKSPVSNIESCTEDSRMLLSFQACPDVQGTESTGERLNDQLTSPTGKKLKHISQFFHLFHVSEQSRNWRAWRHGKTVMHAT